VSSPIWGQEEKHLFHKTASCAIEFFLLLKKIKNPTRDGAHTSDVRQEDPSWDSAPDKFIPDLVGEFSCSDWIEHEDARRRREMTFQSATWREYPPIRVGSRRELITCPGGQSNAFDGRWVVTSAISVLGVVKKYGTKAICALCPLNCRGFIYWVVTFFLSPNSLEMDFLFSSTSKSISQESFWKAPARDRLKIELRRFRPKNHLFF